MKQRQETDRVEAEAVRAFNRFYTRQIGLLEEGLLKSDFSLTEVRILYELAHREGLTASDLSRDLGIDPGYVSRILRKFEDKAYVSRRPAHHDARQSLLSLTEAGRAAFLPLDRASQAEVLAMLAALHPAARQDLLRAMRRIRHLLAPDENPNEPFILRGLAPGDIGWITHRQGILYATEFGWDERFEALVAEIAGAFVSNFDSRRERCWIAERQGEVVGSVFLAKADEETAKLRLLYVEPAARGLGIGSRLVDECIRFARASGYRRIGLWTNDVLVSARRIYESRGFQLRKEEKHHSFGKDLVGQNWERDL